MTDQHPSAQADAPRAYASVTVWGDIDRDTVTAVMGVSPHHAAYKGEVKRPHGPPVKQSYWTWKTEEASSYDGESFLRAMVDWLEQRRAAVSMLHADEKVQSIVVTLVAYIEPHQSAPGVYLDAPTLERFAALGVDLQFDFMVLGAD